MLKTAKKYNASFAAIKLDRALKNQLPAWYHISASKQLRRLDNTALSKCLRLTHHVVTVADIARTARHDAPIATNTDGSEPSCTCAGCENDKRSGCKDPLKCKDAAGRILLLLEHKWNPMMDSPADGLTLTKKRLEANTKAVEKGDAVTFNPSVTEHGGITEAFRVFVDKENITNPPAVRPRRGLTIAADACKAY
ncbi:uncharacterized protein C8Q71DRAFT_716273, partial [Rhodofomes roseus]